MENLLLTRSDDDSPDRQECLSYYLLSFKSDLDERDNVRIVLLLAFKLNQIVVSAARGDGKLTADERSRVIDGALPRFLIQEHTGLSK